MEKIKKKSFHILREKFNNCLMLGFWIYVMSDCLIFSSLFVVHAVIGKNYALGPNGYELFDLKIVSINTMILLLSSLTYGFIISNMNKKIKNKTILSIIFTCLLGILFIVVEIFELNKFIGLGAIPQCSAFLSSFFTILSTHGIHVLFGVISLLVLLIQIKKYGLIKKNRERIICISIFWHFLDIIWIMIFSFVYLFGMY